MYVFLYSIWISFLISLFSFLVFFRSFSFLSFFSVLLNNVVSEKEEGIRIDASKQLVFLAMDYLHGVSEDDAFFYHFFPLPTPYSILIWRLLAALRVT